MKHTQIFCTCMFIYKQSNLDISKLMGLFFTSSNYPECKLICTSGNLDLLKSPQRKITVGESDQNVFLIQIDASSYTEFEISEFEISRVDCISKQTLLQDHSFGLSCRDFSIVCRRIVFQSSR